MVQTGSIISAHSIKAYFKIRLDDGGRSSPLRQTEWMAQLGEQEKGYHEGRGVRFSVATEIIQAYASEIRLKASHSGRK